MSSRAILFVLNFAQRRRSVQPESWIVEGDRTILELEVSPADLGRVFGREGRTVSALRVLVGALARRRGQSVELEILD